MFTFLATDNIGWINEFAKDLRDFAFPFLIVLTVVAGIYAIVLGVKIGISDGADQRSKAITGMINLIIGYVVVLVLCVIFFSVASYMGTGKVTDWLTKNPIFGDGFQQSSENSTGDSTSEQNVNMYIYLQEISSIDDNGYSEMSLALEDFEQNYLNGTSVNLLINVQKSILNGIENGQIDSVQTLINNYIFVSGSDLSNYLVIEKNVGDFYTNVDNFTTEYNSSVSNVENRQYINIRITFTSLFNTNNSVVCDMVFYYIK